METSSVLLWGLCALAIIVILGLVFSKRNALRKEKMEPSIESPEKEYNSDEAEEEISSTIMCSRCSRCEATEEWNDAAVCEDCFDELDNEEDEDDWPKGKTPKYIPSEYSGSSFDLTNLAIGIVVLGITISLGATILGELGESMERASYNSTTSNMTSQSIEAFSAFGSWFPLIFIVGIGAIVLPIVLRMFSRSYDGL